MPDFHLESQYLGKIVAGVDEVGRGPLAGPVVAAAVIANPAIYIEGIRDSKKLSIKKRESINLSIMEHYNYAIGEASVEEIEELNILEATKLAMFRAVGKLELVPDIILVDGNMKFEDKKYISIVKGDDISASIAAASIIAKVYRDNLMKNLSLEYPEYGWEKNAGYGTHMHITAIRAYGSTIHHRKKFISNVNF
ncbi:MAG UNVERIFIED_CONTAM: ribonuclease HII [Rickettsiaceae bacterium]|jgi:ribonuclease HII